MPKREGTWEIGISALTPCLFVVVGGRWAFKVKIARPSDGNERWERKIMIVWVDEFSRATANGFEPALFQPAVDLPRDRIEAS